MVLSLLFLQNLPSRQIFPFLPYALLGLFFLVCLLNLLDQCCQLFLVARVCQSCQELRPPQLARVSLAILVCPQLLEAPDLRVARQAPVDLMAQDRPLFRGVQHCLVFLHFQ